MEKIENYEHLLTKVIYYFENFENGLKPNFKFIEEPIEGIDKRYYDFGFSRQEPLIEYRITSPTGTNPHRFSISSIQEFEDLFGSK